MEAIAVGIATDRVIRKGWLRELWQAFSCLCRSKCSVHETDLDILPHIETLIEHISEKVLEKLQSKQMITML